MSTPPAAGGQGFAFDPHGVETAINDWTRLADDLAVDDQRLDTLRKLNGPGDEFSSEGLAQKTIVAIEAFRRHVASMSSFAENYIAELVAARDEYLARDRGVTGTFERQETS